MTDDDPEPFDTLVEGKFSAKVRVEGPAGELRRVECETCFLLSPQVAGQGGAYDWFVAHLEEAHPTERAN